VDRMASLLIRKIPPFPRKKWTPAPTAVAPRCEIAKETDRDLFGRKRG